MNAVPSPPAGLRCLSWKNHPQSSRPLGAWHLHGPGPGTSTAHASVAASRLEPAGPGRGWARPKLGLETGAHEPGPDRLRAHCYGDLQLPEPSSSCGHLSRAQGLLSVSHGASRQHHSHRCPPSPRGATALERPRRVSPWPPLPGFWAGPALRVDGARG